MDKKYLIEGIAIGAVAGAIATILLAPKSGKQTRDEIKTHLDEIRDCIVTRLEEAGEFTKKKYEQIVKAVISEYEAAKKITADEAQEIETRLREGYEAIKGTVHDHAHGTECDCGKPEAQ
jgi:gas vesicle protein